MGSQGAALERHSLAGTGELRRYSVAFAYLLNCFIQQELYCASAFKCYTDTSLILLILGTKRDITGRMPGCFLSQIAQAFTRTSPGRGQKKVLARALQVQTNISR